MQVNVVQPWKLPIGTLEWWLYRIGVAEKVVCEKVLKSVDWDLERAAHMLLEQ